MNKVAVRCSLLILLAFLISSCTDRTGGNAGEGGELYYVSSDGDDQQSGITPEKAWRTVDRVNQQELSPGDRVLFRSGDQFEGPLILASSDSGTEESRVHISSYGEGKALILGHDEEGLKADSCHFLTIENLEFEGSGRKTGNLTDGVLIRNCNGVILNKIDTHGFQKSGIHVRQCDDAVITRVYAHDNGFAGIHVTGATMNDPEHYDNHNLYIGYCVAENNPGDPTVLENHSGNGILASSVREGIIEYCEAFNNGWDMPWTGNGPVGIWIWDCTDFTIQYCIAHHNRTNPEAADGGGFDFDGGVSNSIIQYCVSHNNEGAGYGLYEFGAAKPWENNIVRYNISQDDGIINGGSVGIWKNDERGIMRNCQIYNNIFYNSKRDGSNIWLYDNYPGYHFRNNVFVYHGSFISGKETLQDEVFQGNLYWNLAGDPSFRGFENLREWALATGREMQGGEFTGHYLDPGFSNSGTLEVTDPEKINAEALEAYIPETGSPLIDNGLDLKELFGVDPGPNDILGTPTPVNERFDIGAIEANGQAIKKSIR